METAFKKRLIFLCATTATTLLSACAGGNQSTAPGGSVLPLAASEQAPSSAFGATRESLAMSRATAQTAPVSYAAGILLDKPSAFFPMNDSTATLADAASAAPAGSYGPLVRHAGPALTVGDKSSAQFSGGAYDPAGFAQVAPAPLLKPASKLSVEAWIELPAANATGTVVPLVAYGEERVSAVPYKLELTPRDAVNFRISAGAPYYKWHVSGRTPLSVGKPHHIVGTYDGANLAIYIDGVLDNTFAAPAGPLKYNDGFSGLDGLAVGGELENTRPNFAGDLSNVAIYPSSLTAAQILNHYHLGTGFVAPTPAPTATPVPVPTLIPNGTTEMPKSTYSFVNSVGWVAHLNYGNTIYTDGWPQVRSMLLDSGAHHIRTSGTGQEAHLADLCANGIKHTLEINIAWGPTDVINGIEQYGPACIDAIEPENEYDGYAYSPKHPDPNWVAHLTASLKMIYTTVRSNPRYAAITILGPGLSSSSRYAMLGNLESISDAGNQHWGNCSGSPDTTHYKNIARSLEYIRVSYPNKPIWTLENAYLDASLVQNPGECALPESVIAKYVPRTFLERFNFGQPHTYEFEFADIPKNGVFGDEGMITANGQAKPAYTATQSLLAAFGTMDRPYQPVPLTYSLTGQTANIHHTLLQRSDGTYFMVLWQEVDSWNSAKRSLIANPLQNVTLNVSSAFTSAKVQSTTQQFTMLSQNVPASGGIQASVGDTPTVISFKL